MGFLLAAKRILSSFVSYIHLDRLSSTNNALKKESLFHYATEYKMTLSAELLLRLLQEHFPHHVGHWFVKDIIYYQSTESSLHEFIIGLLVCRGDDGQCLHKISLRLERYSDPDAEKTIEAALKEEKAVTEGLPDDSAGGAAVDPMPRRPRSIKRSFSPMRSPSCPEQGGANLQRLPDCAVGHVPSVLPPSESSPPSRTSSPTPPAPFPFKPIESFPPNSSPPSLALYRSDGKPVGRSNRSQWNRSQWTSSEGSAGDNFSYYLGHKLPGPQDKACRLMSIKFDTRDAVFTMEELLTIALVLSEQSNTYSPLTTQCYWYAGMLWGIVKHVKEGQYKLRDKKKKQPGKWKFGIDPKALGRLEEEHRLPALEKKYLAAWEVRKSDLLAAKQLKIDEQQSREEFLRREAALNAKIEARGAATKAEIEASARREAAAKAEIEASARRVAAAKAEEAAAKAREADALEELRRLRELISANTAGTHA